MPVAAPSTAPDHKRQVSQAENAGTESQFQATERVLEETIVGNPAVTVISGIVGGAALGFIVGDVIGIIVGAVVGGLAGARARVAH